MHVNFNLQGAKITYEREANVVIDYSSLSRNLKQVRSRHFVCLLCLSVKFINIIAGSQDNLWGSEMGEFSPPFF